ncbi:unnamed protein product [Strongylus vulgaris]|uniref:Uncharacterized protein n=1 Tax=Strongylus vulgaris TaxID=40348 RepID=A0A3P7JQB4_STRVU|nr:unnamed protein product [Strongylus vulgaris]
MNLWATRNFVLYGRSAFIVQKPLGILYFRCSIGFCSGVTATCSSSTDAVSPPISPIQCEVGKELDLIHMIEKVAFSHTDYAKAIA